jgi:purine-nucleoside phosphorylase
MNDSSSLLTKALDHVRRHWPATPQLGIILGTGSGGVARRLRVAATLEYDQVPGFVRSTATGHQGRIICGELAGLPTVAMQGRFHRYEGWSFEQTVFPLRLMAAWGIQGLVVTNAAGGVDPKMRQGDLVLLQSHIDLLSYWPGERPSTARPRPATDGIPSGLSADRPAAPWSADLFPERPVRRGDGGYCERWRAAAQRVANELGVAARAGVYVGLPGPNYETRAEYRLIRKMGGDVVGMSTVSEVALASLLEIPVLGISIVTNVARPDALEKTSGEEVVHAARDVEGTVATIIERSSQVYFSSASSAANDHGT